MIQSTHIQRRCFEIIFERVESNREEVSHPSPRYREYFTAK